MNLNIVINIYNDILLYLKKSIKKITFHDQNFKV